MAADQAGILSHFRNILTNPNHGPCNNLFFAQTKSTIESSSCTRPGLFLPMVPSRSLICMKFVAVRARLRFCLLPRRRPEQTGATEQTRNSRDSRCYDTLVSLYKRAAYKRPICSREAQATIWFGFDLHLVWEVEPLHV